MNSTEAPEPGPADYDRLVDQISRSQSEVQQRIDAANPDGHRVTLVAVTKMFPIEVARVAYACGLVDLGENYAQHLHAKASELGDLPIRWHFIGGLQRNKIKRFGEHVSLWQSMDRLSLVEELAKRFPRAEMLIQVNTTGEPQKSGCEPGDVGRLLEHARDLGLRVRGLMTVGPTDSRVDPVPSFEGLRLLGAQHELDELSMGMSGDFERAVANGSTMVRVGSALFGQRPSAS